jgi:hypothetical protein
VRPQAMPRLHSVFGRLQMGHRRTPSLIASPAAEALHSATAIKRKKSSITIRPKIIAALKPHLPHYRKSDNPPAARSIRDSA